MISSLLTRLSQNLGIKLLALSLALVVYVHVVTEQDQERHLRVPLRVTGLPRNLVLVDPPPATVEINAHAKKKQLWLLRFSESRRPRMTVDLSEVHPGKVQRMLSPADVSEPSGNAIAVNEILSPRMVTFVVDTLVTRAVPVRVAMTGDLPPLVALAAPVRPEPDAVRATGPRATVDSMPELTTEPLRLEEVHDTGRFPLRIVGDRPGVRLDPAAVEVPVSVLHLSRRTYARVMVRLRGLGRGLSGRVDPDTASITVRGPQTAVDSLDGGGFDVFLDAQGLVPGRYLLSPDVNLHAPELRPLSVDPPRFRVEIRGKGR